MAGYVDYSRPCWSVRALACVLLAGLLWPCVSAWAQDEDEIPRDALDRGTPLRSVKGFLLAAGEPDYEKAARYLDLRNLPGDVSALGGPELARQLNAVLSRSVWFDDYVLDDTPSGRQGDELPEYHDELARVPREDGSKTVLYLQHVPRAGDKVLIWKVSNQSVAQIPALYAEQANAPWVESIRKFFPDNSAFLGLETYKWVIGLAFALIAWPILYFFAVVLAKLLVRKASPSHELVRRILTRPLVALGVVAVFSVVIHRLGIGVVAQRIADAKTVIVIIVVWTLWSVIGLYQSYKRNRLVEEGRVGAAQLMRPVGNLLRLLVLLIGLLFWLSNLGVNISTVLAGLGVGGLALALALQKPLEDLMGALTIYSQQPVRVGDLCQYGVFRGTVEEIGLRSTRIRTISNTLINVPNAKFAVSEIENYSARNKIHFKPTLRLRYDSSAKQVRSVVEKIRQMLQSHPGVLDDSLRVRFTDFDDYGIMVKIHSYVNTTDFQEFLEITEELNLNIMEIVHSCGVEFAIPEWDGPGNRNS